MFPTVVLPEIGSWQRLRKGPGDRLKPFTTIYRCIPAIPFCPSIPIKAMATKLVLGQSMLQH